MRLFFVCSTFADCRRISSGFSTEGVSVGLYHCSLIRIPIVGLETAKTFVNFEVVQQTVGVMRSMNRSELKKRAMSVEMDGRVSAQDLDVRE